MGDSSNFIFVELELPERIGMTELFGTQKELIQAQFHPGSVAAIHFLTPDDDVGICDINLFKINNEHMMIPNSEPLNLEQRWLARGDRNLVRMIHSVRYLRDMDKFSFNFEV